MKLLVQILGGLAAICVLAVTAIALFNLDKVKTAENMKRTEAMRAARHKPKDPDPEPEPKTEPVKEPTPQQ